MHDADACKSLHCDIYRNRDTLRSKIVQVAKCHSRPALRSFTGSVSGCMHV